MSSEMMKPQVDRVVLALKRLVFGKKGEPYRFGGRILRFLPGSRPIRTKYRNSPDALSRFDALQVELVLHRLREGDTAIDIGAHAGQYGVLMSARCGQSGWVICFEPDPDAVLKWKGNMVLNPGIKQPLLVRAACSDANGTATFFTQGGNSQSSLAKSAVPQDRETKEIQVEMVRLDDWWATHGNGFWPALVKIDTEGAEIHVLRGMPEMLESGALVVCELHPYAWKELGVGLTDLEQLVAKSGRTMRWLDGSGEVRDPAVYGTVLLEKQKDGTRTPGWSR